MSVPSFNDWFALARAANRGREYSGVGEILAVLVAIGELLEVVFGDNELSGLSPRGIDLRTTVFPALFSEFLGEQLGVGQILLA